MDSPSSADAARRPWLTPGRLVALLGLGVAGAALAFGARTYAGLPELCAFHAMTGLPCPTCGITRSFAATAHGHLMEAFRYHLFGPPAFAAMLGEPLDLHGPALPAHPPLDGLDAGGSGDGLRDRPHGRLVPAALIRPGPQSSGPTS